MAKRDNGRAEQNKVDQSNYAIVEDNYVSVDGIGCRFVYRDGMLGLEFTERIDAFLLSPHTALMLARVLRERALALVD